MPTPPTTIHFAFVLNFDTRVSRWVHICPLLIFHLDPIRGQPITSEQLVRTVGRYRDVMRPRTFGIYNALPLDHAATSVSRIFVLQVCPSADLSTSSGSWFSLPGVTGWAPSPNTALMPIYRHSTNLMRNWLLRAILSAQKKTAWILPGDYPPLRATIKHIGTLWLQILMIFSLILIIFCLS